MMEKLKEIKMKVMEMIPAMPDEVQDKLFEIADLCDELEEEINQKRGGIANVE